MSPFRNIVSLTAADFLSKTFSFLTFVYLARILGVEVYGVSEFSIAIMGYVLLLADGGLESWAIRAVAQGQPIPQLAGRIVSLRLLLAAISYSALILALPLLTPHPLLKTLIPILGLTVFVQAINFKWVFMGSERMPVVAKGLIASQLFFSLVALLLVKSPVEVVWIPIVRVLSDLVVAGYFLYLYFQSHERFQVRITLEEAVSILRKSLVMGSAHALAFMSYNMDSVLLGMLSGSMAVGWYSAAYRPITAMLAVPLSWGLGLFPVLSRTFLGRPEEFRFIMGRSLRLLAFFAIPSGIGIYFWAEPAVQFLFGPQYANSVTPLRILALAAVLVILRGTYRQALNAAGRQDLDLRCAMMATLVNLGLNLLLIPRFSMVGAAVATLVSESIWLSAAIWLSYRNVAQIRFLSSVSQPLIGGLAICSSLLPLQSIWWLYQIPVAMTVYVGTLVALGTHRELFLKQTAYEPTIGH